MDWNTLGAAFIGGIFGGGLGSLVSYLQLRTGRSAALRDQQWRDAGVIADVWELLSDILPERRGINVNPDPVVEGQKSAVLDERQRQVSKELMRFAAGHPSPGVRDVAWLLSSALARAASAADWHVRDLLTPGRDPQQWLTKAQGAHAEANELAQQLEQAVKDAGKR